MRPLAISKPASERRCECPPVSASGSAAAPLQCPSASDPAPLPAPLPNVARPDPAEPGGSQLNCLPTSGPTRRTTAPAKLRARAFSLDDPLSSCPSSMPSQPCTLAVSDAGYTNTQCRFTICTNFRSRHAAAIVIATFHTSQHLPHTLHPKRNHGVVSSLQVPPRHKTPAIPRRPRGCASLIS